MSGTRMTRVTQGAIGEAKIHAPPAILDYSVGARVQNAFLSIYECYI